MAKAKLDKIAKMYHAASALSDNAKMPEIDMVEEERKSREEDEESEKKPSKKLDFNENGGGLKTTIYKRK